MKLRVAVAFALVVGVLACDSVTDPASRPPFNGGSVTVDIGPAPVCPPAPSEECPARRPADPLTASFRTHCGLAFAGYVDPIAWPNTDSPHEHLFYGNSAVSPSSDAWSIKNVGGSTCDGGIANRSAYWIPAMVHAPAGTDQMDPRNHVAATATSVMQVYYKSGYDGVLAESIQNFPAGLRMIAGSPNATTPQTGIVSYKCAVQPSGQLYNQGPTITPCNPGDVFIMSVEFPQCWDGTNLDSPDHKSHMAYGLGLNWLVSPPQHLGCPALHPIPLPQITQNIRWQVPPEGMGDWRLASDRQMGDPPGLSGHADWWNGWDPDVFERMLDHCYRIPASGPRDCQVSLLGDGTRLL